MLPKEGKFFFLEASKPLRGLRGLQRWAACSEGRLLPGMLSMSAGIPASPRGLLAPGVVSWDLSACCLLFGWMGEGPVAGMPLTAMEGPSALLGLPLCARSCSWALPRKCLPPPLPRAYLDPHRQQPRAHLLPSSPPPHSHAPLSLFLGDPYVLEKT